MTPLSVIVLTHNEEASLADCLNSVQILQSPVWVVDSGSTDGTVALARKLGAQVVQHPFEDYSRQRNWAQRHLPLTSDWVLHLDADERLTRPLGLEIEARFRGELTDVDGFLLCRRTVFMGRWIRHGGHYPSYHLRLFRRDKGYCEARLYDQHFVVQGRVQTLRHDFVDTVTSDLTTWAQRHLRWAQLEAAELSREDRPEGQVLPRLLGDPIQRKRWLRTGLYGRLPLFWRAFAYWAYRYFLRLGFLDGVEGLTFHFLQGCWYRFLVDTYLEAARRRTHSLPSPLALPEGTGQRAFPKALDG